MVKVCTHFSHEASLLSLSQAMINNTVNKGISEIVDMIFSILVQYLSLEVLVALLYDIKLMCDKI